jgi:Holliday junction resolvase
MQYQPNYRSNRDSNHAEIVKAIKKLGCSVKDTSAVGGGFPDIIVGIKGQTKNTNVLIEIKSAKGRLRPDQEKFIAKWQGNVAVVRTVAEAEYICNHYLKL